MVTVGRVVMLVTKNKNGYVHQIGEVPKLRRTVCVALVMVTKVFVRICLLKSCHVFPLKSTPLQKNHDAPTKNLPHPHFLME